MGRRNRKRQVFTEVEIVDTAAEGKSLARIDEKILFVPHTVPGDIVDVEVSRKRKRFMEGRVLRYHKYSPQRLEPFCEHFGTCGGCKWQFISYEDQLANKQKWVKDSLERIGKIDIPELPPILGSKQTTFYRNKLEFTFSNKEWLTAEQIKSGENFEDRNALGFHIPGRFDKILNINKCWLQEEPSNSIRLWVKDYAQQHELPFFDLREQSGLLRNLIIRTSSTGESMVIFSFAKNQEEEIKLLLEAFVVAFPKVNSVMYVINEKRNDTIGDLNIKCYHGNDHINEKMPAFFGEKELVFKINPKSFYQTNSQQAYELYKIAAEFADIKKDDVVYDLYTGTGTIANFIADGAKKVVGIEYVPEAIEDAKVNSIHNEIDNTIFFAGDMKDLLTEEFITEQGKADVVITDPPRAGMHADVINQLLNLAADRIVYVSCNPATQARDLSLLDEKYKVERIQAVDMFPHTHHVENVVLLKLNK